MSFYQIADWQSTDDSVQATIHLDAEHHLFKGHFPGMPILPGACMVQLTHHLLDKYLGHKTTFVKSGQIKFLIPVNPLNEPVLKAKMKLTFLPDNQYRVEQSLTKEDRIYFKFSATYQRN